MNKLNTNTEETKDFIAEYREVTEKVLMGIHRQGFGEGYLSACDDHKRACAVTEEELDAKYEARRR